jgi:hypothetical protein
MAEMNKDEYFKKKFNELQKQFETQQKQLEEYERQNPNKKHKGDVTDWKQELFKLQSNFDAEWRVIVKKLQAIFKEDKSNVFKRRAFQMAFLGILWSEIIAFPGIKSLKSTVAFKNLSDTSIELDSNSSVWDDFDENDKNEIINWANQFCASPNVKPEALISGNLWGFILRKIAMCLEKNCQSSHDQKSKIQLFGEFRAGSIEAIGSNLYTDFVITAGCTGMPLFMAELESRGILHLISSKPSSSDKRYLHKDMKKLAVQMAGVLLQKVGMVKKYNEKAGSSKINISALRTFGALISDVRIEFFVSRIIIYNNEKFGIIFESHPEKWAFDLFQNKRRENHETEAQVQSEFTDVVIEIEAESYNDKDFDFKAALESESDDVEELVEFLHPSSD